MLQNLLLLCGGGGGGGGGGLLATAAALVAVRGAVFASALRRDGSARLHLIGLSELLEPPEAATPGNGCSLSYPGSGFPRGIIGVIFASHPRHIIREPAAADPSIQDLLALPLVVLTVPVVASVIVFLVVNAGSLQQHHRWHWSTNRFGPF